MSDGYEEEPEFIAGSRNMIVFNCYKRFKNTTKIFKDKRLKRKNRKSWKKDLEKDLEKDNG